MLFFRRNPQTWFGDGDGFRKGSGPSSFIFCDDDLVVASGFSLPHHRIQGPSLAAASRSPEVPLRPAATVEAGGSAPPKDVGRCETHRLH